MIMFHSQLIVYNKWRLCSQPHVIQNKTNKYDKNESLYLHLKQYQEIFEFIWEMYGMSYLD